MSDITVERAPPRSIAAIGAYTNRAPLLSALAAEFGIAIPAPQSFVRSGPVTLSCLSHSRYFASADRDANLPVRLTKSLSGLAAITDQSDQWAIFTLTCPDSRDALARLVPIDVAPEKFQVGALALTRASHFDVRLWRIGKSTYELAVTRSYEADFRFILQNDDSVLF
jgi:heterotetrameric sarcosine oxidase gamma subunit